MGVYSTFTKSQVPIFLKLITKPETPSIINFMRPIFFETEPLNKNLNLVGNPRDLKAIEGQCESIIGQGVSVKVLDVNNDIVGVLLNYIVRKEDRTKDKTYSNTNYDKILKLFDYLDAKYDVFKKYPNVDRAFCTDIGAIRPDWQQQGLMSILLNYSKKLAVNNNCFLMMTYCTNIYTGRSLRRENFKPVFTMCYEDYKVDGKVVFTPEKPHNVVSIYTYTLPKS